MAGNKQTKKANKRRGRERKGNKIEGKRVEGWKRKDGQERSLYPCAARSSVKCSRTSILYPPHNPPLLPYTLNAAALKEVLFKVIQLSPLLLPVLPEEAAQRSVLLYGRGFPGGSCHANQTSFSSASLSLSVPFAFHPSVLLMEGSRVASAPPSEDLQKEENAISRAPFVRPRNTGWVEGGGGSAGRCCARGMEERGVPGRGQGGTENTRRRIGTR